MENLPDLAVPTGIASALALIFVTLIKSYYAGKESLPKQLRDHINSLIQERKDAVEERDKTYADLETERRAHAETRGRENTAVLANARLTSENRELLETVTEQGIMIAQQQEEIAALRKGESK